MDGLHNGIIYIVGLVRDRDVQCIGSFVFAFVSLIVAMLLIWLCPSWVPCGILGIILIVFAVLLLFYTGYLFNVKCSSTRTEQPLPPRMFFIKTRGYRIEFEHHNLDVINEVSEGSSVRSPCSPTSQGGSEIFKFNRLSNSSEMHPLPEPSDAQENIEETVDSDTPSNDLPTVPSQEPSDGKEDIEDIDSPLSEDSRTVHEECSIGISTKAVSSQHADVNDIKNMDEEKFPPRPPPEGETSKKPTLFKTDSEPSGSTQSLQTEYLFTDLSNGDPSVERTVSEAGDSSEVFDYDIPDSVKSSENVLEIQCSSNNLCPSIPPSSYIEVVPLSPSENVFQSDEVIVSKDKVDTFVECNAVTVATEKTEVVDHKLHSELEDTIFQFGNVVVPKPKVDKLEEGNSAILPSNETEVLERKSHPALKEDATTEGNERAIACFADESISGRVYHAISQTVSEDKPLERRNTWPVNFEMSRPSRKTF